MTDLINTLAAEIHRDAKEKGFYNNKREMGTLLMLVVSELSEALEADRKFRHTDMVAFQNGIEGTEEGDENWQVAFKAFVKDTFEDEIADAIIRLLDICGYAGIDIEEHIRLKRVFNKTRPYKHGKAY